MPEPIYLDNAATTPVDPLILEEMLPFLSEKFGNASSVHRLGQEARAAVDGARRNTARLLNSDPSEIVFTSGGTEANNLAIRGLAESHGMRGHIVTSNIEHPAVRDVCSDLVSRGCSMTAVPVEPDGTVSAEAVNAAIREDTFLVSIMLANNEIGTVQPVAEIGRIVRDLQVMGRKIFLHTDAVQAVGKIPVDVEEISCDLLSLSAHKIHAPKGTGALYVRKGTRLHKQNIGGSQERGMRGGTENVAGIAGLGKACEISHGHLATEAARIESLRTLFESTLRQKVSGMTVNGESAQRLPGISNIIFDKVDGEAVLINLDMQDIAVSTGSACSSGTIEASPVIKALGHEESAARGAVRFSFGRMSTEEEVLRAASVVEETIERLRRLS